ncbi:unnamed protein product [Bursaphelenchus xylophilus]|uniref:(pine wood nematode) hypothetical protein n=1 Tax=Bursaphelenchus xylophilus TaxID=6326 RepID=A0A1I7SAS6_BURXY|nr:unnamed protein product [Bursaphelenchus xylophilus]CAG9126825.1 unnamed protein product [Bursaphelenchus xylophilus]
MLKGNMPQKKAPYIAAPVHSVLIVDKAEEREEDSLDSESIAIYMTAQQDTRNFRNAFLTEIGNEIDKNITLRELVDVIVCAGKNTTVEELSNAYPYSEDAAEISYDEGLYIFQKLPAIEMDNANLMEKLGNGDIDYERIIEEIKDSSIEDLDDVIDFLQKWKKRKFDANEIETEIMSTRHQLLQLNESLVRKQKLDDNALLALNSSTESLSSVFSNTRNSQVPLGDQAPPAISSARMGTSAERAILKSFVIQKSHDLTISIGYTFVLTRAQQICVGFKINEKIDQDLNRFQNHLIGYVTSDSSSVIVALTKRKDDLYRRSEWMLFPPGSYTFCIRFLRPLKVVEPNKDADILTHDGKLTKEYKVMLMNTFDIFDLDDDGLLTREEMETYKMLSGGDRISPDDWAALEKTCQMRERMLTMKGFLDMHQHEIRAMSERQRLDLWGKLKELGYNRKFYLSTGCPVWIELQTGDGLIHMDNFEIAYFTPESDWQLLEFYWENGTNLPYLKELASVRLYKTDYFAVIVAGRMPEKIRYKFDLSASNNVNIQGDDLILDVEVEPDEIKILTVAIAQGESWFLCVKKLLVEPNLTYPAVMPGPSS